MYLNVGESGLGGWAVAGITLWCVSQVDFSGSQHRSIFSKCVGLFEEDNGDNRAVKSKVGRAYDPLQGAERERQ